MIAGFLRAFGRALARPSWLAIITAGAVVVALPLLSLLIDEEDVNKHFAEFLPSHSKDLFAFATFQAIRLENSESTIPAVVLLGASATHESLLEEAYIADSLQHRDIRVDVFRLTLPRQTLWESHAMIAKIPRSRPAFIILGLGPSRFTWTKAQLDDSIRQTRIGFRSEVINAEAKRAGLSPPPRTGYYVLDNLYFLLPRVVRGVIRWALDKPMPYERFRYVAGVTPPQPSEEWASHGQEIMLRMENYDKKFSYNIDFLRSIVRSVHANPHWQIALVEHPINPRFVDEILGRERYEDFISKMTDFSETENVSFWRIHREVGITEDAYYDWAHVQSDDARVEMTDRLIEHIDAELEKPK